MKNDISHKNAPINQDLRYASLKTKKALQFLSNLFKVVADEMEKLKLKRQHS